MEWSALYTSENQPSMEMVAEYINHPLWMEFHSRIQSKYQIEPRMEYSRCSMQAGWNMKYKKSGKSLCTLYPMRDYYIALVVIGRKEMTEAELLMPLCSDYVQTVFHDTKVGNGQKWLMIDVREREVLEDVLNLIQLRK